MTELPMARGLIVCEQVIIDQHTRNASLINCFSGWNVAKFPSDPQKFSTYAILTNGSGSFMMRLRIISLDDFSIIYERLMPFVFSTPREEVVFNLRVRQCVFPRAGAYAVQLLADNEMVTDTRLAIHQGK